MPKILNNSVFKERRRELRKNQTDSEKILWQYLRNKQMKGLKFYRQYGVGPYILDFYCQKLGLAIELDGSQHLEKEKRLYDEARTQFLQSFHIRVIRFWSNDAIKNTKGVLDAIYQATETHP
ncbi:endonuclease domain-containing protein [Candidatus Uhrbacteria bacterium]|nr:endonuclease domain-containing protein [Candidatus Uhrbacteria bacterium]